MHGTRGFFFRFERNRIAIIPSVYNRDTRGIIAASLSLSLSPRKQIMVIDYPTWKPPSGISITYVCIPTGNLPLIRSNSGVTQFTPASNLKWDYLMAQGTIEMGFPTSRGREVLSGLSRIAKDGPPWSKRNSVILVPLHRSNRRTWKSRLLQTHAISVHN